MEDSFLSRLSRPQPDPGGGAAAAHGGLLALALMEKVTRLELRRVVAQDEEPWKASLAAIRSLAGDLAALRERDCLAYLNLAQSRSGALTDSESGDAWEEAIACPALIMRTCSEAQEVLFTIGSTCARHLISDLHVAAEFLAASIRGAYRIATANVSLMPDRAAACGHNENLNELIELARTRGESLQQRLNQRSPRSAF